jgi:hypothetical protein
MRFVLEVIPENTTNASLYSYVRGAESFEELWQVGIQSLQGIFYSFCGHSIA